MSGTAIPLAYSPSDIDRHYTMEQVDLMRIDQRNLLCSNCHQPVHPVRPDDTVHHFRHKENDETCLKSLSEATNDTDIDFDSNSTNNNHGGETSWHRGRKTLFRTIFGNRVACR